MSKLELHEVSVEVTHSCSLYCRMCSSNANYPSPISNELTFREISKILRDGKKYNAKVFSLSGGEPFMRNDVFNLVSYASDLGYEILFYTGGNLLNVHTGHVEQVPMTLWKALKQASTNGLRVVFDVQGCQEDEVDKIMGKEGAFQNILHGIECCNKLKIPWESHFVPMKININRLFETAIMLEKLGCKKMSFLRFVPQGRGRENFMELMLDKKQFRELQWMFIRLTSGDMLDNMKIRLGHPIDRRWMVDPKYPPRLCRGGMDAPLIQPSGNIDPCPAWKDLKMYVAGNVRQQSFYNIWKNSPQYQTFRWFVHGNGWKQINGDCADCPWLSICRGGCVAQRLIANPDKTGDLKRDILVGKDPLCFIDEV